MIPSPIRGCSSCTILPNHLPCLSRSRMNNCWLRCYRQTNRNGTARWTLPPYPYLPSHTIYDRLGQGKLQTTALQGRIQADNRLLEQVRQIRVADRRAVITHRDPHLPALATGCEANFIVRPAAEQRPCDQAFDQTPQELRVRFNLGKVCLPFESQT